MNPNHSRYADWDSVYVLGSLSPAERREYEEHIRGQVSEDHCIQQTESLCERYGSEERSGRAQARYEEDRAGFGNVQSKPLEEPKRQERVHDETAAERIEREE